MVIDDIKSIRCEKKDLRSFGLLLGGVLLFLSAFFQWSDNPLALPFLLASLLFLVFGWIVPSVLKPLYRIWMAAALLMGWVMTRIILTVLFYAVVTPIGLLIRRFGTPPLAEDIDARRHSYWIPKKTDPSVGKDYEKQF